MEDANLKSDGSSSRAIAFDSAEWFERYLVERNRHASFLLIDVLDVPVSGSSVSVIAFPMVNRRDFLGAFADDRYRTQGYEPPLVLLGEILDDDAAGHLAGALGLIRALHGLDSREALGFLVSMLVVMVDGHRAARGQDSFLYIRGSPASVPNHDTLLDAPLDSPVRPLFTVSDVLQVWQRVARIGAHAIYRPSSDAPGRLTYMTIPPMWLSAEQLRVDAAPGDITRLVPVLVDVALVPLVRPFAELLTAANESFPAVNVQLGQPSPPRSPETQPKTAELHRRGANWNLAFDGQNAVVRHSAGMAYLALLLAQPDHEIFVLELVQAARNSGRSQQPDARLALDAAVSSEALRADAGSGVGPLLSEETKQEYWAEIKALQEDYEEAVIVGDDERAREVDAFRASLIQELAKGTGFGGRDRDSKSPSERARTHVRKAITTAIRNIAEAHPSLARHLDASVNTGTRCVYRPTPPLRWKVSP